MSKYTINVSLDGSTITETANQLVISETLAVLAGPSSGAAVTSVNGKSGAVTLTASDVGAPSTSGSYTNPSWIVSLPWSKVTATPTTLSGYGISDGITAAAVASGYASLSGSYSNPAWITGLAWSKVSGTPTTRAGYGITDAQPLDAELTALAGLVSAADSFPYFTGSGTAALFTIGATQRTAIGNLSGTNTGDQTITLTGDVTGSGTGSFAATLANVVTGATVGSSTLVPVITFDAKGRITAATTAALGAYAAWGQVYRDEYIDAAAMAPATTNGPTANKQETGTNAVNVDRLGFDGATQQIAWFKWTVPDEYDGGAIKVKFAWDADTGGSGGVVWDIAARAYGDGDTLDQAMGTAQQIADTVQAVGKVHFTATTPAVTIAGTPTGGKMVIFRVRRVPADASDTMSQVAWLHGVNIQWREAASAPSVW